MGLIHPVYGMEGGRIPHPSTSPLGMIGFQLGRAGPRQPPPDQANIAAPGHVATLLASHGSTPTRDDDEEQAATTVTHLGGAAALEESRTLGDMGCVLITHNQAAQSGIIRRSLTPGTPGGYIAPVATWTT